MDRPTFYILNDNDDPQPVDTDTGARWFGTNDRRVLRETVRRGVDVSTVFLSIDHAWDDGPPVLWETMIFGGRFNGYQRRYRSKLDALRGHVEAVRLVEVYGQLPRRLKKALRDSRRLRSASLRRRLRQALTVPAA